MTPRLSKFVLTAHIALSVGWLGAVGGFLSLSIASLTSKNPEIVRGAYLSMNVIGLYVIVPLSFAALLTGLVQSLGTSWGLFRQYWTAIKFGLTVGAVFLLLLHELGTATRLARYVLSLPAGVLPDAGSMGSQLAVEAAFAVLVLVVTTVLSVYKPWGSHVTAGAFNRRAGCNSMRREHPIGAPYPAQTMHPRILCRSGSGFFWR
jgi:hypothetical protein